MPIELRKVASGNKSPEQVHAPTKKLIADAINPSLFSLFSGAFSCTSLYNIIVIVKLEKIGTRKKNTASTVPTKEGTITNFGEIKIICISRANPNKITAVRKIKTSKYFKSLKTINVLSKESIIITNTSC